MCIFTVIFEGSLSNLTLLAGMYLPILPWYYSRVWAKLKVKMFSKNKLKCSQFFSSAKRSFKMLFHAIMTHAAIKIVTSKFHIFMLIFFKILKWNSQFHTKNIPSCPLPVNSQRKLHYWYLFSSAFLWGDSRWYNFHQICHFSFDLPAPTSLTFFFSPTFLRAIQVQIDLSTWGSFILEQSQASVCIS